jgi:diguanylate cyclase (GGDEF)-like protein
LAAVFGVVSGAAMEALLVRSAVAPDQPTGVQRSAQMRPRLEQLISATRRFGHSFALVVLDIEGPGVRRGHSPEGPDSAVSVVAAALRQSVRLEDETFLLDDGGLCVLAPNQTSAEAGQMARRLSRLLTAVDAAGGLRITVSAGVVACPEHGDDAESLLRQADTAMWRSRSTGQAVTVAGLQDR